MAHEALEVRNQWAHQETFSSDDTYRALDTMERLLCAVDATEQARALREQREDLFSQLFTGQARGTLIDVLVIGYLSPRVRARGADELPHSKVQDADLSDQEGSQQAALNRSIEINAILTRKPVHGASGLHQNTESLSLHELGKLFTNLKADLAAKSPAFRRLPEILLKRVPSLREKLNPNSGYVGYRAASSDRAYVYLQPDYS